MYLILLFFVSSLIHSAASSSFSSSSPSSSGIACCTSNDTSFNDTYFQLTTQQPFYLLPTPHYPKTSFKHFFSHRGPTRLDNPIRNNDQLEDNLVRISLLPPSEETAAASAWLENFALSTESNEFTACIDIAKNNPEFARLFTYAATRMASGYSKNNPRKAIYYLSSLLTFNEKVYGHAGKNLPDHAIVLLSNGFTSPNPDVRFAIYDLFEPEYQNGWKEELGDACAPTIARINQQYGRDLNPSYRNEFGAWLYHTYYRRSVHDSVKVSPEAQKDIVYYLENVHISKAKKISKKFILSHIDGDKETGGKQALDYFLSTRACNITSHKRRFDFLNKALRAGHVPAFDYVRDNARTLFYDYYPLGLETFTLIAKTEPKNIARCSQSSSSSTSPHISYPELIQACNLLVGTDFKRHGSGEPKAQITAEAYFKKAATGPNQQLTAQAKLELADFINKKRRSIKAYDRLIEEFKGKKSLEKVLTETYLRRSLTCESLSSNKNKKLSQESLNLALKGGDVLPRITSEIFIITGKLAAIHRSQPHIADCNTIADCNSIKERLTTLLQELNTLSIPQDQTTIMDALSTYQWNSVQEQAFINLTFLATLLDNTDSHTLIKDQLLASLENPFLRLDHNQFVKFIKDVLNSPSTDESSLAEVDTFLDACKEKTDMSTVVLRAQALKAKRLKDPKEYRFYKHAGHITKDYRYYLQALKKCPQKSQGKCIQRVFKYAPQEKHNAIKIEIAEHYLNNGKPFEAETMVHTIKDKTFPLANLMLGRLRFSGSNNNFSSEEADKYFMAAKPHISKLITSDTESDYIDAMNSLFIYDVYKHLNEGYINMKRYLNNLKNEHHDDLPIKETLTLFNNLYKEMEEALLNEDILADPECTHWVKKETYLVMAHAYADAHDITLDQKNRTLLAFQCRSFLNKAEADGSYSPKAEYLKTRLLMPPKGISPNSSIHERLNDLTEIYQRVRSHPERNDNFFQQLILRGIKHAFNVTNTDTPTTMYKEAN